MRSILLNTLFWAFSGLAFACAGEEGRTTEPVPHYEDRAYADPSEELFDPANLPRFDIVLADEAMDALRRAPRTYVSATLRYRDQELQAVGLRLKGTTSFRDIDEKPSFRIKLDEFIDDQTLLGLDKLTLNNAIQDPTFLSERLAYSIYREAGLPAARANSALVYVNGDYYGIYTNVETMDELFLARWFDSDEGNLYEHGHSDLVPGAETTFELDTNKKKNDRSDLIGLIEALDRATPGTFMAEVGAHLDIDQFLKYAALELLVGHRDGYAYRHTQPNNFHLYHDPSTDRFVFLPSGMDQTLRPYSAPALIHNWIPPAETFLSPWDVYGLVLDRCIASPECRARYLATVIELSDFFAELGLEARMETLIAQIDTAVRADERKEMDNDYFEVAVETMRLYVRGAPAAIRAGVQ